MLLSACAPEHAEFESIAVVVDPGIDASTCWTAGADRRDPARPELSIDLHCRRSSPRSLVVEASLVNRAGYRQRTELEIALDEHESPVARVRSRSESLDRTEEWRVHDVHGTVRISDAATLRDGPSPARPFTCRWELDGECSGSRVGVNGSIVVTELEDR